MQINFRPDSLEGLLKSLLIETNSISIYLTEQVKHEFNRMKEDVIQEALDKFSSLAISLNTPPIFSLDDSYRKLTEKAKEFNKDLYQLHTRYSEQFKNNQLEADIVIDIIFNKAKHHKTTPELLDKARTRMEIRNPPGKNNELGDRLNWETLLSWDETDNLYPQVKNNDFYIISNDGDYFRGKTNEIKIYLQKEWRKSKTNNLLGYKSLKDFFGEKFPKEKLAIDLEKEVLIDKLENSGSFSATHDILEKLARIENLSRNQVNRIIEAYINNSQIFGILNDRDVLSYLKFIIKNYAHDITASNQEKISNFG